MPRKADTLRTLQSKADRARRIRKAVALYAAGKSSRRAAELAGLTMATVLKHTRLAGGTIRPRGPVPLKVKE